MCNESLGTQNECSALYNGMVHALTNGPMTLKAMVWYQVSSPVSPSRIRSLLPLDLTRLNVSHQGEQNSGDAVNYACRFPAFITDMRALFKQPALPFFYVEMDGCISYGAHDGGLDGLFPTTRAAQRAAVVSLKVVDTSSIPSPTTRR